MIVRTLRALLTLYTWDLPKQLVISYRKHHSSIWKYLRWLHTTKTFRVEGTRWPTDIAAIALLLGVMFSTIGLGAYFFVEWARFGYTELLSFGLAAFVGYPFITAYALVIGVLVRRILYYAIHPKKIGRDLVCIILEQQVRSLRRAHQIKVVAVAGSVGKTSTKLAIADLVGQSLRVRHQVGNYNDRVTVPLVFFDQSMPSLLNPFAWARLIGENAAAVHQPYPYDVVVIEIGTDAPGQMRQFAYLKPDITVITAITPEHMERFGTLDEVAAEELTVFRYSKRVLVNADDIPGKYLAGLAFEEYSVTTNAAHNYYAKPSAPSLSGQKLEIELPSGSFKATVAYVGLPGAKYAVVAAAVSDMLGIAKKDIQSGLARLEPFAGRMQVLEGVHGSTLLDDTYNSTPVAAKAALDVLYAAKSSQRIAILGSMNELGDYAREAHQEVGAYCNPRKLSMVVTVGADAKRWLALAAKEKGCVVHSFMSPYEAGNFVATHLQKGAVVLGKGSQNHIFVEESLKRLLAHPADASKFVRQSRAWLRIKAKPFNA